MRPKSNKKICCCPVARLFKPAGCDKDVQSSVKLTTEEVEALDLKNVKNLDQVNAAKAMGTSQSTFQRILSSAYEKVSDALVNGKVIELEENNLKNRDCNN